MGAVSADHRVEGTYLHGCFTADEFRRANISSLGEASPASSSFSTLIDETLDALARHLATSADLDRVLQIAKPVEG